MIHTHTTHTDTHTQKWTVNSPPVVSGALNGLGWWPNQNECIYPPTIHLAFSSSFFSFVFSLLGYFTRLLSSRQRARHHKKTKQKNYFEWRRNGGWGARTSRICITKDSQIAPVSDNAHYCITNKTLFELQGHTKIYIYIYHIFGNDCATRHRWFVKTPSYNLVSYLGNAKCQGSLNAISVCFSRCDDRTAGKKKPNEKKQEEKRNQKNWGGGRPRAKLESRPTGSRCCLLLSKVCRVENVEKKK